MKLIEGGNVVPNAIELRKANFPSVMANLKKVLPQGINLYPIGSAGKKEISSDIDVLVDAEELMSAFPQSKDLKSARQSLELYFKEKGLFAARTGVSVHVGIPIGTTQNLVQVDIMAVENAAAAQPLHTHDYSRDPSMKGGTLHAIWADLANLSSTPELSLMMSPYKGLVNRTTKELITNNKDEIAKRIIGPDASAQDMSSVGGILDSLKKYPEKYKAIKDKYAPAADLQEGSREWFRFLMDHIL